MEFFNVRWNNRYMGCIYRDTCTTSCYIRWKILGGIENDDLSLPMKRRFGASCDARKCTIFGYG